GGLLVFAAAAPALAAVGEDAGEELFAGFVGAAFGLGEFGFGGDEAAFAGGLEDGGAVALEVGLHAAQCDHAGIEAGELLFDFGDDFRLFLLWRNRNFEAQKHGEFETLNRRASLCASMKNFPLVCLEHQCEIVGTYLLSRLDRLDVLVERDLS